MIANRLLAAISARTPALKTVGTRADKLTENTFATKLINLLIEIKTTENPKPKPRHRMIFEQRKQPKKLNLGFKTSERVNGEVLC